MTKTNLAVALLLVCLPLSAFGTVAFSNVKGKLESMNTVYWDWGTVW